MNFFLSFFLCKNIKDYITGRGLSLNLELPYLKSFRSSLQSHLLWVHFKIFCETRLK